MDLETTFNVQDLKMGVQFANSLYGVKIVEKDGDK